MSMETVGMGQMIWWSKIQKVMAVSTAIQNFQHWVL